MKSERVEEVEFIGVEKLIYADVGKEEKEREEEAFDQRVAVSSAYMQEKTSVGRQYDHNLKHAMAEMRHIEDMYR